MSGNNKSVDMYIEETVPERMREQVARVMRLGMGYVPLSIDALVFTGRYDRQPISDSPIFRAMDINSVESTSDECVIDLRGDDTEKLTDSQFMHGILMCCAVHQLRSIGQWLRLLATNPTLFDANRGLLDAAEQVLPLVAAYVCEPLGVAAEQIMSDSGAECTERPLVCPRCDHAASMYISPGVGDVDEQSDAFRCPECGGTMEFCDGRHT